MLDVSSLQLAWAIWPWAGIVVAMKFQLDSFNDRAVRPIPVAQECSLIRGSLAIFVRDLSKGKRS